MSRSCACTRWLSLAVTNPAFRLLPDALRLFWFDVVALAAAAPETGVLRFPQSVSPSVPQSVSRLVSVAETDAETWLAQLAGIGMVEWQPGAETLALPGAVKATSARANGARINGLSGGRPRRGETPEQARLRRQQGALVLPIRGGAAAPAAKPNAETLSESDNQNSNQKSDLTARVENALALAKEVAALAGMDPARSTWHARDVQGWLAAGATRQLVLDVVADVMSRAKGVPGGLRYFDAAVRRALAENAQAPALPPGAAAVASPKAEWARQFDAHLNAGGKPGAFPRFEAWMVQPGHATPQSAA